MQLVGRENINAFSCYTDWTILTMRIVSTIYKIHMPWNICINSNYGVFHATIVRYLTPFRFWKVTFHILRTTLAKVLHCFSENFISNSKTVTLYKYLYASLVSNENELYLKHLIAWKNWVKFGFNELRKLLSNSKKLHLFTNQCLPEHRQV